VFLSYRLPTRRCVRGRDCALIPRHCMPLVEDGDDVESQPVKLDTSDTTVGLFGNDQPKPVRKRKSRALQRPQSDSSSSSSSSSSTIAVPHASDGSVVCVPKPLHGPASSSERKVPGMGTGKHKQTAPHNHPAPTKASTNRTSPAPPPTMKKAIQVPTSANLYYVSRHVPLCYLCVCVCVCVPV